MQDPEKLKALHRDRYGAEPKVFAAPGRVNLIGEHTDYAEGFVMPAAIDFATLAGISPRTDGKVAIRSENLRRGASLRGRSAAGGAVAALERLSDGRAEDAGAGPASRSGAESHSLGRCAAGIGAVEFGGDRGNDGVSGCGPGWRELCRSRHGAAVPASGERVCGIELRHHGPVCQCKRAGGPRSAT